MSTTAADSCQQTSAITDRFLEALFPTRSSGISVVLRSSSKLRAPVPDPSVAALDVNLSVSEQLGKCVLKYHNQIKQVGGLVCVDLTADQTKISVKLPLIQTDNEEATRLNAVRAKPFPPPNTSVAFMLLSSAKLNCKSPETIAALISDMSAEIRNCITEVTPTITSNGGKVKYAFAKHGACIQVKQPSSHKRSDSFTVLDEES